jgi:hypothetical protein
MKILHIEKKGTMLNVQENFRIYEIKQNLQLNEALTYTYNPVFNVLLQAKSIAQNTFPLPN